MGLLILLFLASSFAVDVVNGNLGFPVHYKFKGQKRSLSALKAHDVRRHSRFLFDVDMELGGNDLTIGLYFAKIGIGSPSKDYYVLVDTGSDDLWVNCIGCKDCPKKSDLLIKLTLYDSNDSYTSTSVTCDQPFCTSIYDGPLPDCKPNLLCPLNDTYGDGSSARGYYVKDTVQLDRVTGNLQTIKHSANGSIIFGCAEQSAYNSSSGALDGILGFGQANSSMISQLASAGKVKKMFAHCLDNINGGGIFAIGEVVQPKVNTTPLVPNQSHYNVVLKDIEVGGDVLLSYDTFDNGILNGTIIDSGTTLAYLPDIVYSALVPKILDQQPGLKLHTTIKDTFTCFQYNGSIDDGFPTVTFHFEGSLSLTVYPHEYLFLSDQDNMWCASFQNAEKLPDKDFRKITLLGDLVLSNKLVLYDLENQTIGWTEYNCSSSIKVKDESGVLYSVGAHNISPASTLIIGRRTLTLLLLLIAMLVY